MNAQGALWLLEGMEFLSSVKVEHVSSSTRNPSTTATKAENTLVPNAYVMISYQWGHQERILRLRETLRSHGIPVWIDVERMQGWTLEAMERRRADCRCQLQVQGVSEL